MPGINAFRRAGGSKRNFIIEVVAGDGARLSRRWRRPAFMAASAAADGCAVAVLRPVQHDELGIEALQHDFGAVTLPDMSAAPFD
jgi:hypothetical protein